MMWQKEYVDFAQTFKGGRMQDDAAAAQWAQWAHDLTANPDTTELIHDMLGPVFSPLRTHSSCFYTTRACT